MNRNWTEFIIGLIMLISPWTLGFSDISVAKWFDVLVGLVLVLISAWAIFVPPMPQEPVEKTTKHKK